MEFIQNYTGELAALLVAVFWTITALAFESASLKVGSMSVNVIRLFIGLAFLTIFNLVYKGSLFPFRADGYNWLWLTLSGLIGFVFGDYFLFRSYTIIGSRFAMLIMTLVPPITAFFSWFILRERLTLLNYAGMCLTFSGIAMAIFNRRNGKEKLSLKLAPIGLLFAFFGALGQALGLVLSKLGMADSDPFAATQVRLVAGFTGFVIIVTLLKRWSDVRTALSNRAGVRAIFLGSFFGPFLGVSFSLVSVKYIAAGIASTLMAIVPVLIIPPAVLLFRQKVTLWEVAGAFISVIGVALFFIK
ncbi:MAG: DMT family transporter [Bacteroidales bacterium]|jgi:drug/metabolite transporter (DMT)-like permease|nr:DMT family transporter [Bacteroidales bacterium]